MSVRIIQGDVREELPKLAADYFDCIVTSPPYYQLRDYNCDGQIGLEPTLDAYLETMVAVCRELRRVLKPSGVFFLNCGDSYAANRSYQISQTKHKSHDFGSSNAIRCPYGLKPKDLCLVPERLGIALQEPWYGGKIKNIADRIWLAAMIDAEGCIYIHKRKAGTSAYSKFRHSDGTEVEYFRTNDSFAIGIEVANTCEAIIRKCVEIVGNGSVSTQGPEDNARRKQLIYRWHLRCDEAKSLIREIYPHLVSKQQQARIALGSPSSGPAADAAHQALIGLHNGVTSSVDFKAPESMFSPGWYIRSHVIWSKKNCMPESVTDRPTSAHETIWMLTKSPRYFWDGEAVREDAATFERQRSFGKSPKTIALEENGTHGEGGNLGIRYDRQARNLRNVWSVASHPFSQAHFATMPPEIAERCIKAGSPAGGHVLDPFAGAGTTGLVADRLGRDATLIDLNTSYIDMAVNRIRDDAPLFAKVAAE